MKKLRFGHRSIGLLVLLFGVIASVSFAHQGAGNWLLLLLATVLLGLGGAYVLYTSRKWLILYCTAAVLMVILESLSYRSESLPLAVAGNLASIATTGLLLLAILNYSLLAEGVHRTDRVVSGLCGYLLIGILWSSVLHLIYVTVPYSFVDPNGGGVDNSDFLYLSLVTLTTLGYGDVAPVSTPARMFCVLEAIFGTLYIAVFISSLIAGYRTETGAQVGLRKRE